MSDFDSNNDARRLSLNLIRAQMIACHLRWMLQIRRSRLRYRLLLFASVFGLLTLFAVTLYDPLYLQTLCGFARRESFYRGRPTSYWRVRLYEYSDKLDGKSYPYYRAVDADFPFARVEEPPISADDPASASVLIELSTDLDEIIRRFAVLALGNDQSADQTIVAALALRLNDSDITVRQMAAFSLMRLGPQASQASPAIQAALDDSDPTVQLQASRALFAIEGEVDLILPALQRIVSLDDQMLTPAAVELLMKIHKDRKNIKIIPLLIAALKSKEFNARTWSIGILEEYGAEAKSAVPELSKCLTDDDEIVRLLSRRALNEIRRVQK